ncbi:MAG: hypothetical protein TREMPRED_005367 [Tremellales sp. Tagirdzhanova-0007]|nr:MAG: hypothetical protein TREMPRED_005367 [Tremellales sp. Tagirdzhanova-0007]
MEAKLHKLKVTELKELLATHHLVQTGKKDDLVKRLLENKIDIGDDHEDEDPELEDVADPQKTEAVETPSSRIPVAIPSASGVNSSPLTPEQQALKARAERFGLPFDPNSTSKRTASTPTKATPTPSTPNTGVSDDVLAKRAAKFGLPEKKDTVPKEGSTLTAGSASGKKAEEIDPKMAQQLAIEEEKKRKRAAKFGTGAAATKGAATDSDAKKVKV